MAESGLAVLRRPIPTVLRTGLQADGWLLGALTTSRPPLADIGRAQGEETIWLSARMGRDGRGNKLPSVQVDYRDTPETIAMRGEVEEINTFLASQSIELHGQPQAAFKLRRQFTLRSPTDPHRFDLHGRLYGGFWMNLPRAQRDGLRINGEPIADLDFASMFPRLAYAKIGKEPPEGDLYALPGLEEHRAGAKAAMSALLSTATDMRRLTPELKAALPVGWTAKRLKHAAGLRHPDLVPLFGRDLALDLMFLESTILVEAMKRLAGRGVASLPMHDGMMVPLSKAIEGAEAMHDASLAIIGVSNPVVHKAVS